VGEAEGEKIADPVYVVTGDSEPVVQTEHVLDADELVLLDATLVAELDSTREGEVDVVEE
jgi:hypothetical protein